MDDWERSTQHLYNFEDQVDVCADTDYMAVWR